MPVIGFLSGFSPSGSVDVLNSFSQGLGETGHVTPPSVALQPGSAIEVQHDVKIVGRWQGRTNVWRNREATMHSILPECAFGALSRKQVGHSLTRGWRPHMTLKSGSD